MTDYMNLIDKINVPELVKALRLCARGNCRECGRYDLECEDNLHRDAAAVIEELQDKVFELEEELNDADIAADDNRRQVEELQVEVGRLKAANDELREAQTYIDHYGDKWLTSAKDVPTSAYNHGYMDGKNEAEQALEPKRGEWEQVGDNTYKCTNCGEISCCKGKYCPDCGAKMGTQE